MPKMHDRSGWEQSGTGPRYIRGRNYPKLCEFKRPCATCGESFSIYVTPRIAEGLADTNSFALRNCELHRRGKVKIAENKSEKMPWEA